VRRLAFLTLGLLLWVAPAAAGPAAPKEAPPLDNEAIVGMVMQRLPEAEIVKAIDAAPHVDFDLEEDVVVELRRVGVTDKILAAMRRRQAENPAPPPPPPAPLPTGTLEIRSAAAAEDKKASEPAVFQVIKKTPRWAANELGMLQRAELEELAFFVVCTRPDHVPDHWQDRTELKQFARHEKLLFRPGSRPGKMKGFETLVLELPEALPVQVPEGDHRLAVGVAAKAGADWHVLGSDARDPVRIVAGATTALRIALGGKVAGSRTTGFTEEQVISILEVIPPEEGS
jgi:hypothetical protein